jgi:hypothetical protein
MIKIRALSKILPFAFLVFLLLPLTSQASQNLKVVSWQENTVLNSTGKIAEVLIHAEVKNLGKNQVMTSFSISFDPSRNIKITDVICDGKPAQFSFENKSLNIKFAKAKNNNDPFLVYFAYDETYSKINKFLRQEMIEIPAFAAGAKSKVILNFPGYFESATLNPNITKNNNSFVYSNLVPAEGVQEIIKLTPSQSSWDVAIKANISSAKGLKNATVFMPIFFQNGGQTVENISIKSSTEPLDLKSDKAFNILKYKTQNLSIVLENKARITIGKNNRTPINRNPSNYLEVSKHEKELLLPIIENIKNSSEYENLPLYAKIGKFVHKLIRYDINYIGKLPSITEILQNPVGVCSEYSLLYNSLARVANIPSINVEGAACGEYDKCMGHAWNMIYHDGRWIDVDPTWDLMSGIVSSSHVYFNDNGSGAISIEYFDTKDSVNSAMDFEMINIK